MSFVDTDYAVDHKLTGSVVTFSRAKDIVINNWYLQNHYHHYIYKVALVYQSLIKKNIVAKVYVIGKLQGFTGNPRTDRRIGSAIPLRLPVDIFIIPKENKTSKLLLTKFEED